MTGFDPFSLSLCDKQLIEASAGTGKTHTITTIYLRAVIELGLLPKQLLVVTFTRAATAELKERIRWSLRGVQLALARPHRITDAALQNYLSQLDDRPLALRHLNRALEGIDEAAIFTIHGFCQRLLEQNAFESRTRFDMELLESLDELRDEVHNDALISELGQAIPAVLRRFATQAGVLRSAQLVTAIHARPDLRFLPDVSKHRPITEAIETFQNAQEQARRCFDSVGIRQLLTNHPGLNRTKVAIRHLPAKLAQIARLLRPNAEAEPWPERCVLQYSYLQECLTKAHPSPPEHPFFHACDTLREAHRQLTLVLESEQFSLELSCAQTALALESSRKASLGIQGFDDLLLGVQKALYSPLGEELARALRERYRLALIDEFQDTDPIQYAIFSRIYAGPKASLFLIGDPKQSIYSFRGADLHAYLSAAKSPELGRHSLDINWRSDPGLIRAINTLYSGQRAPFLYPEIEYRPVQPRPNARDQFDDQGQALTGLSIAFITSDDMTAILDRRTARRRSAFHAALHVQDLVSRSVQGRAISPSDVAILTRTNAEAELMQQALRALNLKSALATDTSVFSTEAAVQLTLLLRALVHPYDSSAVTSALLTTGMGYQPSELAARLEDTLAWDDEVEKFVYGDDLLARHGIFAATQHIFEVYDVVPHLLQRPAGERRVTDLYHLLELAELQIAKQNLSPTALLRWMQRMQQDPSEVANEARQLRIESDEHSVVITTIHRSKGLEYPFVFCPFLWTDSARLPDKDGLITYHDDDSDSWVADLRGKDAPAPVLAAARREREAEGLRLIYVAITRAIHAVTVFLPAVRSLQNTALGQFLRRIMEAREMSVG